MLTLQRYDFPLTYIPWKDAVVSDTLSRVYLNDCKTGISAENMEAHVYLINKSWPMTDKKLSSYYEISAPEESLKLLAKYTLH